MPNREKKFSSSRSTKRKRGFFVLVHRLDNARSRQRRQLAHPHLKCISVDNWKSGWLHVTFSMTSVSLTSLRPGKWHFDNVLEQPIHSRKPEVAASSSSNIDVLCDKDAPLGIEERLEHKRGRIGG
jgi:hypothetical protein